MALSATTCVSTKHAPAAAASSVPVRPLARTRAPFGSSAAHHHLARGSTCRAQASSSDSPVRSALSGLASSIYKATASFQEVDSSLPPLWQGLKKLDKNAVAAALRAGADPNDTNTLGDTPLLYIAREGHYKYPPAEIPALLIQSGADLEAKDSNGRTALQVALLSGWQNIAELLLKAGAQRGTVTSDVKAAITCPDCKRIVATYNL